MTTLTLNFPADTTPVGPSLLPRELQGITSYSEQLTAFLISTSVTQVSKTRGLLQESALAESIRILQGNHFYTLTHSHTNKEMEAQKKGFLKV